MPKHKINAFFHVGGRKACWDKFSVFLTKQTYPHKDIKLIVVNTAPEHRWYKEWLDQCDYEHVYYDTPLYSPTYDRDARLREMCRNQVPILETYVDADYLWTLDDDLIPPLNVLDQLLPHFTEDKIMAVSACYRLAPRIGLHNLYCCWPLYEPLRYYRKGHGIQNTGAACWGCCLFRLKDGKPMWSFGPHPTENADVACYQRIDQLGGISLVNWDAECDHLADDGNNPYPTQKIPFI